MTERTTAVLEQTCFELLRLGADAIRFVPTGQFYLQAGHHLDRVLRAAQRVPRDDAALAAAAREALDALEALFTRTESFRCPEAYQLLLDIAYEPAN